MTVEIQLTKGYTATVDDIDADLAGLKWCVTGGRTTYAQRRVRPQIVLMHRVILERKEGRQLEASEYCDHVNGNSLDNRRENLRIASSRQNAANRKNRVTSTSGYKGVSWNKHAQKWSAQIGINGKQKHLGYFPTAEEAHAAYYETARKYFGEFARAE